MPGRFCSPVTLGVLSFHRIPKELLKLWLLALHMEPSIQAEKVKRADHKVCSLHFHPDDFYPRKPEPAPAKKRRNGLRKTIPPKGTLSTKA